MRGAFDIPKHYTPKLSNEEKEDDLESSSQSYSASENSNISDTHLDNRMNMLNQVSDKIKSKTII
jgi:hypothetical protein